MCKLSHHLKLCTCNSDLDQLENYWVLHRFIKGKDIEVFGEVMLPVDIDPADNAYNKALLLQLLNEGNVFDVELNPKPKDRLQLSFKLGKDAYPNKVTYGFQYSKGKWKAIEYDGLMWMWHHEEEQTGEIEIGGKHGT